MSASLHFPSQETIVSYLQQHPLTDDVNLNKRGIIQAAAKAFANREKVLMGVKTTVALMMIDLNEKLAQPAPDATIQKNLIQALIDCANGKKIQEDKKPVITSNL